MSRSARRRRRGEVTQNDRSWMKHSRCSICRRRFCVNNYGDHKVRVPKIAGHIVCANCKWRDGVYLIQLRLIAERIAKEGVGHEEGCKCLPCAAQRIMDAHDALPSIR